jgi:cyclophilin family peptidyl-prolyl cis-trans isomerase
MERKVPGLSRFVTILAASLLLSVLAACGDDSDIEDPTPTQQIAESAAEPVSTDEPDENQPEGQQQMEWDSAPAMQLEQGKNYSATIKTNKGEIVVDLFETEVPVTVNNFVFLAEQGFYTDVPFHRVINGFMIQTGDPTGSGAGGPGYRFADEPVTRDYERGIVAMANAGPNTNGSQFFIMHADNPLPKNYTIFGQVVSGLDVVDALATTPVSANARGERSVPNEPLVMESVTISSE